MTLKSVSRLSKLFIITCFSFFSLSCQDDSLHSTPCAGNFLAIADIHLDQDTTSITYGQDTGKALFSSTLTQLARVIDEQHPQFMLYLGDSPAHTQFHRASNIQLVLDALSREITATPLFYIYGNNDSYNLGPHPTDNYGPFSQQGVNLFDLDPGTAWPALNVTSCPARTACIHSKTSPDRAFMQRYGFYSAYPLGSNTPLRLIVLNSVIFSYQYTEPLAIQQAQAQLEMDWLAAQLQDAKTKNERVYLAMHIPVGIGAFNAAHPDFWNTTMVLNGNKTPALAGLTLRNAFLSLADTYKDTIRLLITGHTHTEEFRVLYWGKSSYHPTLLDVGVPGITPRRGNNPGLVVYYYDAAYQLIDALTYFTTPEPITWQTFRFRKDFACPPRSTLFSCVLTQLIPYLAEGSASVSQYKANYAVRSPVFSPTPLTTWETILSTIQVYPVA